MNIEIFKVRSIGKDKKYVLASGNLFEYLKELNPKAFRFDIQRKIVENQYLDVLSESVKKGLPFPAITLTSSDVFSADSHIIDLNNCEILDGLQRTFRLWALYFIYNIINKHPEKNYREIYDILKTEDGGKDIIGFRILNRTALKTLMSKNGDQLEIENIIESFKNYDVTFNIWFGLNDEEIVNQMLILNAGHKRVSRIHQFEIIYLHYFDKNLLEIPQGMRILREKENDYKQISSLNNRQTGMFALSSVMIAFQSYYMGRPQKIKGVNQVNLDFENSEIARYFSDVLISKTLSKFLGLLYDLDKKISIIPNAGHWLAKDTSLSGIFAAFGSRVPFDEDYNDFITLRGLIEDLKPEDLDLSGYQKAYDSLASNKINVGNTLRNAVFEAFKNYKSGHKINWEEAFGKL